MYSIMALSTVVRIWSFIYLCFCFRYQRKQIIWALKRTTRTLKAIIFEIILFFSSSSGLSFSIFPSESKVIESPY